MNIKTISAAVGAVAMIELVFGSVAPAEAASFKFSYTFSSGETVAGTVDGELQADNNRVDNLSNLSAIYSGQPGTPLKFLPSTIPTFFTLSGTPFFRFFGFADDPNTSTSQPNFGFFLGNPFTINGASVGTFQTSSSFIVFASDTQEEEPFSPSRWTASATAIPTPALLPGLIGMGVAAIRKRKQESIAQLETADV